MPRHWTFVSCLVSGGVVLRIDITINDLRSYLFHSSVTTSIVCTMNHVPCTTYQVTTYHQCPNGFGKSPFHQDNLKLIWGQYVWIGIMNLKRFNDSQKLTVLSQGPTPPSFNFPVICLRLVWACQFITMPFPQLNKYVCYIIKISLNTYW